MESDTRRHDVSSHLYDPISASEYRVVHILPGKFRDEIQCILETRNSATWTPYEALSYQWGSDVGARQIRIANLQTTRRQMKTWSVLSILSGEMRSRILRQWTRVCQITGCRLNLVPFRLMIPIVTAFIVLRFEYDFGISAWSFLPESLFLPLLGIIIGVCLVVVLPFFLELVRDIAKTELWRLFPLLNLSFRWRCLNAIAGASVFEEFPITSNLELALRYLRKEDTHRTMWIDAICINQRREDEKMSQIENMGAIYANAAKVIAWLGGYHDVPLLYDNCHNGGVVCKHQTQIAAAFDCLELVRDPDFSGDIEFSRDSHHKSQVAREGLLSIVRRGWWERLWVIQEVVLAMGQIQVQCGHFIASFDEFGVGLGDIEKMNRDDEIFSAACQPCLNFDVLNFECKNHLINDSENQIAVHIWDHLFHQLCWLIGLKTELTPRDKAFASRIGSILLRTSGRFHCLNETDRLYAVLGIAGKFTTGTYFKPASLMLLIALLPFPFSLLYLLPHWYKCMAFVILYLFVMQVRLWESGPLSYSVGKGPRIPGVLGTEKPIRVAFFTGLSRYLAEELQCLSFLDVATCGEDSDKAMPSWAAVWSMEYIPQAYLRLLIKGSTIYRPPNLFTFSQDGKVLNLLGKAEKVDFMTCEEIKELKTHPELRYLNGMYILYLRIERLGNVSTERDMRDGEETQPLKDILQARAADAIAPGTETSTAGSSEIQAVMISRSSGYYGKEELIIRAGQVKKGDYLVLVPGCYHRLVLRLQENSPRNSPRWKLVGLIEPGKNKHFPFVTRDNWDKLLKDGEVEQYSIE